MKTFRTHDRIVFPFVLIAIVATVAAALISLSFISGTLEQREQMHVANAAAFVSRSQFALNASVLPLVKEIVNADVLTFDRNGRTLASTIAAENARLVEAVIANRPDARAPGSADARTVRPMVVDATPYLVAYRPIAAQPDTILAIAADTSAVVAAISTARMRILSAAAVSVLLFFVVTHLIAKRVSAPIERILGLMRASDLGAPVPLPPPGDDEFARLERGFIDMVGRLRSSQEAVLRSEKLALAGLLAARVAHDIRNPLSSIKMQAQLLGSRVNVAADQTLVRTLLHDVDQVESVVRGLLEIARPGELQLKRVDLADCIAEVMQQLSSQMSHRRIDVQLELPADRCPVVIDVERFRQALLNLVINAAEAMADGGILRIVAAGAGGFATIDVCDNGHGIDPSIASRLFDPFVSTKRDGVGLGLVNTKAVIESHGGTVELEPREEGGTRARIRLPLRPA